MARIFHDEEKFENRKYQAITPDPGDYENCTFINCDFSGADLSGINFLECEFQDCNLSLTNLNQTAFKDIRFRHCKLLGLHFEDCNNLTISMDFDNCIINLCSFSRLKLRKTLFTDCRIEESDFTEADLSNSVFRSCNLDRSSFMHTNLEGVDLRSSFNFRIDPELNRIKNARFSLPSVGGLLAKYDIDIE